MQVTQGYFTPNSEVLEFGCGTGGTSVIHAPYVKHILATDVSQAMIDIGKQRAEDAKVSNIDFQKASVEELDIPIASKDVVLGLSILHLLPNRDQVIHQVHSWLKPGGVFVTSTACIGDMGLGARVLV
ncbi:MAG: class I SAM-dependent methyltransferase, partial [Pseudomonadota bacterium]